MSSQNVQIFYEPSGCNCDGTAYTRAEINAAASKALELAGQNQTLGQSSCTSRKQRVRCEDKVH